MADAGFPLKHELLRGIAQHIVNKRQMIQCGYKAGNGGTNTTFAVTKPRVRQQSLTVPPIAPIHVVSIHWVDRFLKCNSGFKKVYVRYQERARAAASEDKELQADFLRKLSNLLR